MDKPKLDEFTLALVTDLIKSYRMHSCARACIAAKRSDKIAERAHVNTMNVLEEIEKEINSARTIM